MSKFPAALPHGPLEEVFPDVFFVTGTMQTVLNGDDWQFSRNMTVVRSQDTLSLINSVRLNEEGLSTLEEMGRIANVIRLGCMHGVDDAFYLDRYVPTYWTAPAMDHELGLVADRILGTGDDHPFDGCDEFLFETTVLPEAILILDRSGGIAIASDALQNWTQPDSYFSDATIERMQAIGFFRKANVGPVWLQVAQPAAEDFSRLQKYSYRHALCGHGKPLRDTAHEDFGSTFQALFDAA